MGIALIKTTAPQMQNVLALASMVGTVDSIHFPKFWLDPCEVRIYTHLVPEGEHEAQMEVSKEYEDKEVIVKLKLKIVSEISEAAVAA